MNWDGANETDVREELANPLLLQLGYQRGSENDILRELSLKYDRIFLGRKKNTDPPLRGRADYVLSVTGSGRWIFEIKGPNETITEDAVAQAISYARHPEIAGTYAVITNGKQILVFHNSQTQNDEPILRIEVESLEQVVEQTRGVLSPASIRRDCTPPRVDTGIPLADGYRSSAAIVGGEIVYESYEWACNHPELMQQRDTMDQLCRFLKGFRSNVREGRVWRNEQGQIIAKLVWSLPHEEMARHILNEELMDFEYISLASEISTDSNNPTVFDVAGDLLVREGEELYDIHRWRSSVIGIDTEMSLRGQAIGHLDGNTFRGGFQSEISMTFPTIPLNIEVEFFGTGSFSLTLDGR